MVNICGRGWAVVQRRAGPESSGRVEFGRLAAWGRDAPSLVPVKPGDRIKTDRRDAKRLLGHFTAGQLTEVYPPNAEQEAARELTRSRQSAQENLKRTRHQLLKFLTRHGYIYNAGRHWTQKHLQWLRALEFDLTDLREVFEIYYVELQHCMQRLSSLDKQVEELARRPEYRKVVALLRCFKGIDTLTAMMREYQLQGKSKTA